MEIQTLTKANGIPEIFNGQIVEIGCNGTMDNSQPESDADNSVSVKAGTTGSRLKSGLALVGAGILQHDLARDLEGCFLEMRVSSVAIPSVVVHLGDLDEEVTTGATFCNIFNTTGLYIKLVDEEALH